MEIKILSKENDKMKIRIIGEGQTLGNILQKTLLEDERVEGAGVFIPHPLKKEMVLDVFLKTKGDPVQVVRENIERLKKDIDDIRKTIQEGLGEEATEA